MAENAWTDGPWFVRERPTDDGLAVIEDGRQDGLFPITCEWGEAYLIAAAPDLYERLEKSTRLMIAERDAFYDSVTTSTGIIPDPVDGRTLAEMDAEIEANRAALAKAEKG